MSAVVRAAAAAPTAAVTAPAARPSALVRCYRFELLKLVSQWRVRLLLLVCWVAPGAFVAVVSRQSALPTDTVFGRQMHATGWAGGLVVLAFACLWALPLLTALVAGDVFAAEDRLGTWRHLLVAVRSTRAIFAGKALASATVIGRLVLGLAVSGLVGGLLSAGGAPLAGLDGAPLGGSQVVGRFVLAWLVVLAPTAAFAAVGLLGSVALGRSPMGLVLPAALAVALAVVQLLPLPLAVRLALPSQAFTAWRGLFVADVMVGPVVVGVVVALAWAGVATAVAYRLFRRRDFTNVADDGSGARLVLAGLAPLAVLLAASVAVVAVATPASGSGVEQDRLEASLATSYAHLYRRQAADLNRPAVTEEQLRTSAACDKGGSLVADAGPGNDWRCVVTWHLPGTTAVGTAVYQLDVAADGRYVADGDGPQEVNGFFLVRTSYGAAPNPLWQLDGLVDLLPPTRKD